MIFSVVPRTRNFLVFFCVVETSFQSYEECHLKIVNVSNFYEIMVRIALESVFRTATSKAFFVFDMVIEAMKEDFWTESCHYDSVKCLNDEIIHSDLKTIDHVAGRRHSHCLANEENLLAWSAMLFPFVVDWLMQILVW